MKKVYEELEKKVDMDIMMMRGTYLTYYENGFDYAEQVQLENPTEENIKQNIEDVFGHEVKDINDPFIILDSGYSEGGYLFDETETAYSIVEFMKSESAYRKFLVDKYA